MPVNQCDLRWPDATKAKHLDGPARAHNMREQSAQISFTGFWRVSTSRRTQVRVPASVTYDELLRGNCIGHMGYVPPLHWSKPLARLCLLIFAFAQTPLAPLSTRLGLQQMLQENGGISPRQRPQNNLEDRFVADFRINSRTLNAEENQT